MGLVTRTVNFHLLNIDGTSLEGKEILINAERFFGGTSGSDNITVPAVRMRVELDGDSKASVELYTVDSGGGVVYSFLLPDGDHFEAVLEPGDPIAFETLRQTAVVANNPIDEVAALITDVVTALVGDLPTFGGGPPTDGQVLAWNDANSQYEPITIAGGGSAIPVTEKGAANGVATLDGSALIPDAQIPASIARDSEIPTAITDLSDVGGSAPTDGQVLAWVDANSQYEPADPASGGIPVSEKGAVNGVAELDGSGTVPDAQIPASIARDSELPDVSGIATNASAITALDGRVTTLEGAGPYLLQSARSSANGVAALDGSATVPDNQIPASIARDTEVPDVITDLDDVGGAAPTNGQVLTWVDANSRYEPSTITGGGGIPVSEKGAANGVATLDGSALIPDAQIPSSIARDSELPTELADLTDVGGTAPTDGQVLQYVNANTQYEAITPPWIESTEKGAANGVASLDGSGTIPDAQIPASIARDSELPDTSGIAVNAANIATNVSDIADRIPLAQKGAANGVAELDGSSTIPDGQIPASIARDSELPTQLSDLSDFGGAAPTDGQVLHYVNANTQFEPITAPWIDASEKGANNGVATLDGSGLVPDAQIPASIARDSELPTELADLTDVGGAAPTDGQVLQYVNANTQYEAITPPWIESTEKGAANGVATLDGSGLIPDAQIPAAIARDSELPTSVFDLTDVGEFDLTDAATVAVDASLGSLFKLVTTVDRTIGIPTNRTAGEALTLAIKNNDAAAITITLTTAGTGSFRFGAEVTGLEDIAPGTTSYITTIYNGDDDRYDVVGQSTGY